jgi:hypothetical protein
MADRVGRVRSVNAVDRVAEIEGACAHGIARAACHPARQIRLAGDHFRRRRPIRPFGFAGNAQNTLPREAVAADTDAVAHRAVVALDHVEVAVGGVDHHSAGRFLAPIGDRLAAILVGNLRRRRLQFVLVAHLAGHRLFDGRVGNAVERTVKLSARDSGGRGSGKKAEQCGPAVHEWKTPEGIGGNAKLRASPMPSAASG